MAVARVAGSETLPGRISLRQGKPAASRVSARVTRGQSWRFCLLCGAVHNKQNAPYAVMRPPTCNLRNSKGRAGFGGA